MNNTRINKNMKFDRLITQVLEDYEADKTKEHNAGESAHNFIVELHKDGKLVKSGVGGKTFTNRKQATSYADACNRNKKPGEYYSVKNN